MISFKPGTKLGLVPEIWGALFVAEDVFKGVDAPVVVTSGREGQHIETSLHPVGRAVDLRITHIPSIRWGALHKVLTFRLPQYIILLETTPPAGLSDVTQWAPHIHIGYKGVVA